MANMFSRKTDKQIPKTLAECTKGVATVDNLHAWAERLENWGKTLLVLLITTGIVSTIIEGISIADIDEDQVFITCLSSIIKWGFYAFVEYCLYHVLALLISALASITQNTIVSANVALYEATKDTSNNEAQTNSSEKTVESQKTSFNSQPIEHSTPATGCAAVSAPPLTSIPADDGDIICPVCGKKQRSTRQVCWSCGQKFKK